MQYFSYIMATSLSGGSIRIEPPTMDKTLVNFIIWEKARLAAHFGENI
jgi:aspartyl-tRNA synthetase